MTKPLWMQIREAFERKGYFHPSPELRDELVGIAIDYADQKTAAARAEIERLTAERNETAMLLSLHMKRAEKAEAERDEARAQVAAALEAAADTLQDVANNWDCGHMESRLCDCARDAEQWGFAADEVRSLTPAHAKAALEAYGREKVREGMQRAATICDSYCAEYLKPGADWQPDYVSAWETGGLDHLLAARDAILTAMEKEGEK